MTRKEKIAELDAFYAPKFKIQEDKIIDAQSRLDELRGNYLSKLERINEYYDALDKKPLIDTVIARGEPTI